MPLARHAFAFVLISLAMPGVLLAAEPEPLVIAHRGASGLLPEHTLAAYGLAIEQGADYVEPDVVSTKDGVLICRHEPELGVTTDVAQKFPERKRKIKFGNAEFEGWFAEDFTLAEIKTLRSRQAMRFRNQEHNGQHEIPTLDEMIEFVQAKSKEAGRTVGIIPETKHSTYHAAIGLPLEAKLLATLEKYGYTDADDPCILQSFETANLKELSQKTKLRLMQLMGGPKSRPLDVQLAGGTLTFGEMMTPGGLRGVAEYAWAIGPPKENIVPCKNGRVGAPTSLVSDAHAAGLKVIVYTFRDEPMFLAADYGGDPLKELEQWFALGIDGLFTDFPATAVKARQEFVNK